MLMMPSWSHEKIITFINEVHSRPELWDVSDNNYKDRDAKKDSWTEIGAKFNMTSQEAYKKFRNLRTYAKTEAKKKNCEGKQVTWFAYDAISFILDRDMQDNVYGKDSGNGSKKNTKTQRIESSDLIEIDEAWNSDDSSESTAVVESLSKSRKKNTSRSHATENTYKRSTHLNSSCERTSSAFGEHVVNKLNSYDKYTRAQVEFKISKILYEADMGMLQDPLCTVHRQSSPQESKYGLQTDTMGTSADGGMRNHRRDYES